MNEPSQVEPKKNTKKKNHRFFDIFRKLVGDANNTEIAKKIGVSSQTISNWLSNTYVPDIVALEKIADAYNTSTDYLLGRTKSMLKDDKIQAACDVTGLSDNAVIALLDLKLICERKSRAYTDLLSCLLEGTNLEYWLGLLEGYITDGDEIISSSLSMSHVDIKVKDIAISAITNTLTDILDSKSSDFLEKYKTTQTRINEWASKEFGIDIDEINKIQNKEKL